MNNSPVGWPGAVMPPQNAASGWQRSSHGNSGYGWQGWPRHARLKPSPGSRLLSGAEAWWDASVYSPDSRTWRNLGMAGPCANLKRDTVNPFIYLTPDREDYLFLLGKNNVGQSVSCTAPVDAVSYIAYDVSGTSISGAVTGGSAFIFESAGKWTKISLLDVLTNVVGEFVVALTDTFGYTDTYGVDWTISYTSTIGTQYTKPAIVRTVDKGGLPFFNYGAKNDAVASKWDCTTAGGVFDITSGNTMTALAVTRVTGSLGQYGDWLSWGLKAPAGSTADNLKWSLSTGFITGVGYSAVVGNCNGMTTSPINLDATANKMGKKCLVSIVVYGAGRSVAVNVTGASGNITAGAATTYTKGMQGVQGGSYFSSGSNMGNSAWYSNSEVYALAFFRRALTTAELQTIADHYGCE